MSQKAARDFLKGQANNLITAIRELTDEELKDALKVAKNYSPTNCWFVEYWMKDAFIQAIEGRMEDLEIINKQSTP